MLSLFAKEHISDWCLHAAQEKKDSEERAGLINQAFDEFDRLANSLNQIFEQFNINVLVTRGGFIPGRMTGLTERSISRHSKYCPTQNGIRSATIWRICSMTIKSRVIRRPSQKRTVQYNVFLQILVGNEGKNGKGELGILFARARKEGVISENQFTREIVKVFQGFISSKRAKNSTAKPALRPASSSDALLVMNVVMVFLQHCLQNAGHAGDLQ